VQKDGWVEIPDRPGFGIEVDRAAIAQFTVA
jgi:L-alanine-DL-glutamate epimerase-like enolase superfamily enzyme